MYSFLSKSGRFLLSYSCSYLCFWSPIAEMATARLRRKFYHDGDKDSCCPQSKTRLAFHFLSFSQFVWLQFTSSSYILLSNSLHTFLCSSQQVLNFLILWMITNPTPHVCRLQEANLEACGTMVVTDLW